MRPAYLELLASGELEQRARTAKRWLRECRCCPHACGADRGGGELGLCRSGRLALVDAAAPHHGEEPCLSGRLGSGTIFFGNCNLECVFCQNWDLSQGGRGVLLEPEEIAAWMLELQERGCHNINLVSPSHVVPQVVLAVAVAARRGLQLPIVYNSNAYDSLDSLRLLNGLVDIYMPDFKFWQPPTARRLSGTEDYPDCARAALLEMQRQVGSLQLDAQGLATRGVLVRHLVVPGLAEESEAILRWLATEVASDTCVNIMDQYRPCYLVGSEADDGEVLFPEIDQPLARDEFERMLQFGRDLGLRVL